MTLRAILMLPLLAVVGPAADPPAPNPAEAAAGVKEVIGHMGSCADRPGNTLAGIRRAKFARFGVVQMTMRERDQGYVRMSLEEHQVDPEPGTDEALLLEGYVTVSPVRPPTVARDVELDELPDLVAYQTGG